MTACVRRHVAERDVVDLRVGATPLVRFAAVVGVRLGDAHRTQPEVVAEEIRDMIRRGDPPPGERLLEDRLAEQLGVARNPVGEAIRALENTGLVDATPPRGARITTLDPERAVELRSVLGAFAAQLAARPRTPEHLEDIRSIFESGKQATAGG